MKILLLLFMLCGTLHAKDRSYFDISAGSGDNPTKVQFIITDSQGRKTGFKSFFTTERGTLLVNVYKQIPKSNYFTDYTGSLDTSVVSNEPESAEFGIDGPVAIDTYTINIIGLGNTKYFLQMDANDKNGNRILTFSKNTIRSYVIAGSTQQYSIYIDPTPGAPAPVITKVVTFDTLRQDLTVAQKLNQLGDDKFVGSLTRTVNLAEHLADKCKKHKMNKCVPAVMVLKMFIKRLEIANRRCDNKNPQLCDEDNDWNDFTKAHHKDHDYDDFFKDWDRDDWHKDKKTCKRFVTDEALKIIKEDAGWLIKSLGCEIDKDHGKGDFDRDNYHSDKEDRKANH